MRLRAYNVSAQYDLVVFIMALVNSNRPLKASQMHKQSNQQQQRSESVHQSQQRYEHENTMTSSACERSGGCTEEFWLIPESGTDDDMSWDFV